MAGKTFGVNGGIVEHTSGVQVGEKTWGIEVIPPRIYEVNETAE